MHNFRGQVDEGTIKAFHNIENLPLVNYTKFMVPIYSDTHPKMEALQVELLRQTPAYRKMEMLVSLNQSARTLVLSGLRQRFPHASDAELNRYLAEILLGTELANRVCGEESGAG